MTDPHKENTKRIAKNTIFLYGRMLFGMLVSLYTSRVILSALGVEDYGIQNVVGGLVGMLSLVTSSLGSAISRFITFELGTGDEKRLREVFSTALLIQIVFSIIVLIIAETAGLWFLSNKMTIPVDRMYAANWIYQASIVSFIFGLLNSPFTALLIAHERMNAFAYFGILSVFLNLFIVLFIAYAPFHFDKLIVYSLLLVSLGITMQVIFCRYCWKHFKESHSMPAFHKRSWKAMSGFAAWDAIGCTAGIMKDQGVNVLLNIFCGPVVNAARGIAGSVSNAVCGFSGNFMTAVSPQITKSYAADDRDYLFMLIERASRFGFYLILCLSLPIVLETKFILDIWLGHYPEFSVIFVKLTLIYALLEVLSRSLITLQSATGRIRNYQIAVGGLLLMNFPLSYVALKFGAQPYAVYIIALTVGVCCLLLRLAFLRRMVGLSVKGYLNNVVLNTACTAMAACVAPLVMYLCMPEGIVRFMVVAFVSVASAALSCLYVGCSLQERTFILSKLRLIKDKLSVSFSR